MIGYVTLGTNDVAKALAFYDALLGSIGARRLMEFGEDAGNFTMYGTGWDQPALAITRPYDGNAAVPGNGNMVAIVMDATDKVDAFHARALELGGTCDGPPGYRGDGEMFYAAYVRDPEGHKLCAFKAAVG